MSGAPYIIWSPDGETPPKVSYDNHAHALSTAWHMAKQQPGRRFFVMARAGKGALAEAQGIEAGTGETGTGSTRSAKARSEGCAQMEAVSNGQ